MNAKYPTLQLKSTYLAMRKALDVNLIPLGLTAAQFDVLKHLHANDGLGHRELQRLLNVASPTLTIVIEGMVEKGLVERRPSKVDARAKHLFLTAKARALGAHIKRAARAFDRRLYTGFTAEEIVAFENALERITRNVVKEVEKVERGQTRRRA